MKTKLTELLDIKYPIIMGGMMWVGRDELASSISNAGGLGIPTALTKPTPDDLRKGIERCREMTEKPFGVNFTLMPSINTLPYVDYPRAVIDSGVKVMETSSHSPEEHLPTLKAAGVKVIHKCTSVRHALEAEKIGCDVVSVDGSERAGYPGEDDITNLVLLPAASKQLSIPMVASGGIGTGSHLADRYTGFGGIGYQYG